MSDDPLVLKVNWTQGEKAVLQSFSLQDGHQFTCMQLPTLKDTKLEDFDSLDAYKDFVIHVLESTNSCQELRYLPEHLRTDRDVFVAACRSRSPAEDDHPMQHLPDECPLKWDREIYLDAVHAGDLSFKKHYHPIHDMPDDCPLRWERDVVIDACRFACVDEMFDDPRHPAPYAILNDREVMAAAITGSSDRYITYAKNRKRCDRYHSLWNGALDFASDALRSDREFVRWAVLEHGCALASAT